MTKLYGIKNCDTMKKAMTWLTDNGVAYEFVDYKKAGVAEASLPDWAARAGWEKLLNTRGLMWKKLSNDEHLLRRIEAASLGRVRCPRVRVVR